MVSMVAGRTTVQSGAGSGAWQAIDERFGLSGLSYPVPAHANRIGYILGGISVIGFAILAVTGIWLAQFYHATSETARESVVYIMNVVPLGDVVRGIHSWTANIVMATVLLHLGRVVATGTYKRPREGNWLIGLGLLAMTLGLVFTGTVLKWDQEGFEALGHNIEIGNLIGAFGFWFSADFAATLPIIGRLYVAHIVILPGIAVLLLIAHFLLVKRHGISALPAEADLALDGGPAPDRSGATFSAHIVRMVGFGLILLAAAMVLSVVWPAGLGPRPTPGVEETKPPWMFLPFYPFEDWFGLPALLWAPAILFGGLALLPFLDRSPYRSWRRRKVIVGIAALVAVALVLLAAYALVTAPQAHVQAVP